MIIFITKIISSDVILDANTDQNAIDVDNSVHMENKSSLFLIQANPSDLISKDQFSQFLLYPINENLQLYDSLGPKNISQSTVVIIPILTFLAYSENGFYDYYSGKCGEECLTVNASIEVSKLQFDYRSSSMANQVFEILGYDRITDIDVNNNPSVLSKYDRVIVLHNEYVTQSEFDAITNHPKVIYLYPNALYAKVLIDYEKDSVKLIRGHGYPDKNITNGFDWKFENTNPYEFDNKCKDWKFYEIDNGFMLNCYPENIIFNDIVFLQTLLNL